MGLTPDTKPDRERRAVLEALKSKCERLKRDVDRAKAEYLDAIRQFHNEVNREPQ